MIVHFQLAQFRVKHLKIQQGEMEGEKEGEKRDDTLLTQLT